MQKLRDNPACADPEHAALLLPRSRLRRSRRPHVRHTLRPLPIQVPWPCCLWWFFIRRRPRRWSRLGKIHSHERCSPQTFSAFFNRPDTFTLGVCNGCQMLTRIQELIPGAENWPTFVETVSQQFEARVSMVKIQDTSPSVFFGGMSGSSIPIAVSHGEGRAEFSSPADLQSLDQEGLIPLRYTDNYGAITQQYPSNPNGSPQGIAGVKSRDGGRVLALMPHPERTIMADVCSWAPKEELEKWEPFGPWFRLFLNARRWVG